MVKQLGLALAFLGLVLGPNALWLIRSTIRIENRSALPVEDALVWACGRPLPLGALPPGAARFRLLPRCGEDSVELHSGIERTNCMIYVESDMYHVRAWYTSPMTGDCTYGGMPPFSPLLLAEAVW